MKQKAKLSNKDMQAIMESAFFALGEPLSTQDLLQLFHAEKPSLESIKKALAGLQEKYQTENHGIELKAVAGGYQLRTKEENKDYIRRLIKGRLFQLSAPAMEVLVIVAYRQPCTKSKIDEIRGVESGHLLKTLMEKELVCFGPKSKDPGRYITYKTTAQFLEVFGLKNLKELPSSQDVKDLLSSEIDSSEDLEKTNLTAVIDSLSGAPKSPTEQKKISEELKRISKEISSVNPKKDNLVTGVPS